MLKTILLLLLIYIAYRFIFGFVIPVTRATRNVRQQFKAAQEQMEAQMRAQQEYYQQQQQAQTAQARAERPGSRGNTPTDTGDYIDFEEVK
ncbi:DUF4834 family protein [Flavihumibacter rivuli]|uniref:DUF4834 family protein n=1 Tax=Flavihumibacter rivuli TaxID=2838156 RepID=UPI001BDEB3EC|nr:DUF4834 family protein [Flavihumibacter rivuli]ULQ56030.1 DUF4834 family protein [Flavihumibacter rivuli]